MHTSKKVHPQHSLGYEPNMINQYAYCPEKDKIQLKDFLPLIIKHVLNI